MITQTKDIPATPVDSKSLATLIIELNIARRNCRAYPKGHPVVAASLAKVLNIYEDLLNTHEELIIGVTSDALMVDGVILEKSNLVYRDFSRALFERGIGALLFHRGLTIEELTNFTVILGLKREQINLHGGIEQVWTKARITAMSILPIRYDLFQSKDDDSEAVAVTDWPGEGLWDRFARELTHGNMPHESKDSACLDPEILAEFLNHQFVSGTITELQVRQVITDFFAPLADNNSSSENHAAASHQKMAAFISNLTPELRRQFLNSSFGAASHGVVNSAESIISNLSDKAIFETLEDINHNRLSVSSTVFGLLQRLGQNAASSQPNAEINAEDDEISSKMKTILREHASEEFVPDDYQKKLNYIIAADQIPRLNMEEVSDLLKTLENRSVESSIGQILLNLIREGVETPEERDLLLQNLSDMFGFFLQTGDYGQLIMMIDQMSDGTFPVEIQYRLRDEYGRREFLDEILDGLTIWGKPRYEDIRTLIKKISGQFIEAILDRLAEEKNMSLRRFYMDSLIDLGPVTRVPIVNRLYDKRWYFLRNLLIILSAQNDQSVVPLIQPLLRSEDPRLRHEALKSLVRFRDPQAEKIVLEDLDNQNHELQSAAIQLAEHCKAPAIAARLIKMVTTGGFTQVEYERKRTIVHALGEIGRAEVLPELAKILSSWSLLHSKPLAKLKTDIIRSLPKYPVQVSRPILEHIANSSGEFARLAAETLKIISGRSS